MNLWTCGCCGALNDGHCWACSRCKRDHLSRHASTIVAETNRAVRETCDDME